MTSPDTSSRRTRRATQMGAGGLDWIALWQAMIDAERANPTATMGPPTSKPDWWAGKARTFAQASERKPQPDAFMQFILPHLHADDTVLDIGAGPGRHALYLTQHVAQVVVVEPSAAMRQQLAERRGSVSEAQLTVVEGAWPEVAVSPCDVAICAHVLYGVREIVPFLQAMDGAARRACFILLGMRQPSYALAPFWERVHRTTRNPLPGALECLNVLHQIGIPAQLALVPTSRYTYADAEEALDDLRWRLQLPANAATDAYLRSAIVDLLERDATGRLTPRGQPAYTGVLWWTTDDRPPTTGE